MSIEKQNALLKHRTCRYFDEFVSFLEKEVSGFMVDERKAEQIKNFDNEFQ